MGEEDNEPAEQTSTALATRAPFRLPAKVESPALAALARRQDWLAEATMKDIGELSASLRERRIGALAHASGGGAGGGILAVIGVVVSVVGATDGHILSTLAGVALLIAGITLIVWARTSRPAARAELLDWPSTLPFPTSGLNEWLSSTTPLMEVRLRAQVDSKVLEDAVRTVASKALVYEVSERDVRIALPTHCMGSLQDFVNELLIPLHNDVGIERLQLGGTDVDHWGLAADATRQLTD